MVIVIGNITVRSDALGQALILSREHVSRSRLEPGCISHSIHIDAEDPNRLMFVERWASMEDLEAHFQVPEYGAFIAAMGAFATAAPEMNLYESSEIQRH